MEKQLKIKRVEHNPYRPISYNDIVRIGNGKTAYVVTGVYSYMNGETSDPMLSLINPLTGAHKTRLTSEVKRIYTAAKVVYEE